MTCVHLRKLYKLCQENELKFSGSDLVRIVCNVCQQQEVCPSALFDNYTPAEDDEDEVSQRRAPRTENHTAD